MTAGIYDTRKRALLMAIWQDFGERLGRILDGGGRFVSEQQRHDIEQLKQVTLAAMEDVRLGR